LEIQLETPLEWRGYSYFENSITDIIAVLDLRFCDYADNGEYTCTLHVNGGECAATSFVHVQGVVFTFLHVMHCLIYKKSNFYNV
jgi:hypothetical protein